MSNPLNGVVVEQRCDNALKTCNFDSSTGEDCASQFCEGFPGTPGTCPQMGLDPQNFCGSDDPASCLYSWVNNGGGGNATPNVCASVVSIIVECPSADPGLFPSNSIYASGPQATALTGCMCYDQNGTYDPELDEFASECVSSGSAAHPTYYTYGSLLKNFCTHNASPAVASATATATGAAAATITTAPAAQSTTKTVPVSTRSSQEVQAATASNAVPVRFDFKDCGHFERKVELCFSSFSYACKHCFNLVRINKEIPPGIWRLPSSPL